MQLVSGSGKSSGQVEADHELDKVMLRWVKAYGLLPTTTEPTAIDYIKAYQHLCHSVMTGVLEVFENGPEA